jgi:hypothetical protein
VDRILGQRLGIVGIRVAERDPEHALLHQLDQRVRPLAHLPPIPATRGQRRRQAQSPIRRLEQQPAPIGAAVLEIHLDHQRLREKPAKQNALCSRVVIHEGPRLWRKRCMQPASTTSRTFVRSLFANNPG